MSGDFRLSIYFSFYELTTTSNKILIARNRELALAEFVPALKATAQLLEVIRPDTGPLAVHSAFRSPELNGATAGSSKTSQHMRGEAADISGMRPLVSEADLDAFFQIVLTALIRANFPFGQIIKESAQRGYETSRWVHLSLGVPFRPPERCGEVLTMKDGKYELIKRIPFNR